MEAHVTSSACKLRILCLCRGATEAVCALGLQSNLVGRAHQCTGPASILTLPCVSSLDIPMLPDPSPHCDINCQNTFERYNINWELLQELKPDLIFAQSRVRADTHLPLQDQQLTDRKCRVVSLQSHSVEDIFQNLEMIANCCGVEKEGTKLVSLLRSQWKNIKQKTPQWADGMPQVNVACLSCVNPLIGAGYWIPEIISCAGGLSLCGRAGCPSKSLTLGDLTQRNPDVVVYLSYRLHAASLATELSWLVTSKEWRNLKAIKANRFFLIDANRFFIDSASNVISSAELMTEILHGFGYGHEGKGFVRWQSCAIFKDMPDVKVSLQQNAVGTKVPALVANHIDVDKHEVRSSAAHDHPKYVTDVYRVKKPALPERCEKECRGVNAKSDVDRRGVNATLDVWDRDLGVVESKEDTQQGIRSAVETRRCMPAKIIRQVPSDTLPPQDENVISHYSDGNAIDFHEDWHKPATESPSLKRNTTPSAQKTLNSINSFFVHDQKERMVDTKLAHASSHCLPKQSFLNKVASLGAYRQAHSTEGGFCDQVLISKVWASAQSAAQMRNKERVFQKSTSLPVSRGSLDSKASSASINAINTHFLGASPQSAHFLGESPQQASSFSVNRDHHKPSIEGTSCLQPAMDSLYASGGNCNQATARRREESSRRAEMVPKRRSSYSVPSSPRLDAKPRKSRMMRDAVLKSLVDLPYIDCLLLSGGLASSILAEAVPLVHSKGFTLGFTVLAGPAATDRASAAVAAKCKGMEHVIIGEGEKGFAVFLLAKELTFIVETLKTFDPIQIRNLVPIAAALREAKSRGLEHVVTGDGLDELLSRDGIPLNDVQTVHLGILKVLSKSAVLLGEALGIKVVQPFLHPKLIREWKALSRTHVVGNQTTEHGRAILREAFPEVSAACREKSFNEVDSGMFYVSDYFSSAISASILENKAKHIYQKERICIRDAEHLVYYRAFKRVFKGKAPKGMVRWASKPCSGCGYQLSSEMSWYCLVCGLSQQSRCNQSKQHKPEQANVRHENKPLNSKGSSERLQRSSIGDVSVQSNRATCEDAKETGSVVSVGSTKSDGGHGSKRFAKSDGGHDSNGATCEEPKERGSVVSVGSAKSDGGHHGSKRLASEVKRQTNCAHHKPPIAKPVVTRAKGLQRPKQKPIKGKQPNFWAILGAGSAGLLLLLQLSRR